MRFLVRTAGYAPRSPPRGSRAESSRSGASRGSKGRGRAWRGACPRRLVKRRGKGPPPPPRRAGGGREGGKVPRWAGDRPARVGAERGRTSAVGARFSPGGGGRVVVSGRQENRAARLSRRAPAFE